MGKIKLDKTYIFKISIKCIHFASPILTAFSCNVSINKTKEITLWKFFWKILFLHFGKYIIGFFFKKRRKRIVPLYFWKMDFASASPHWLTSSPHFTFTSHQFRESHLPVRQKIIPCENFDCKVLKSSRANVAPNILNGLFFQCA